MFIEQLDGTRSHIRERNLRRLFHHIPSPNIEHSIEEVVDRHSVITGSKFNNRTIRVQFLYDAYDIYDYYLMRDEIHAFFMQTEPYYIIFEREPYKRWLVRVANQFEIPPHPHMEAFYVEFITENCYAESVGTSLQLVEKSIDSGLWGWVRGIEWDENYKYVFNTSSFKVINVGNVAIDPRMHNIEITVKGSFPNGLTITNDTTGDVYKFEERLLATDVLVLRGVNTFKNGASAFGRTNKKLLTFKPGANYLRVSGASGAFEVKINTRFYYL